MAEAVLQVLIENLASLIQEEIGLIRGVKKEMNKLSDTLTAIQKVLEDAEDKQFHDTSIKNWLSKLNEIAFEIEDILDECVTEVSKNKKRKGVCRFVKRTLYNHRIGKRMKEVTEKLDAIAADRRNFHLYESEVAAKSSEVDWRRQTGSIVNEPYHIYGRDEDRDEIVDVLVNQVPNCDHQLSVLPITGVGGLGKTTLAQLVYNDERITQHFDTKLWVCVSDNFDLKVLVKAMIEFATGSPIYLVEFAALECRLRDELKDKKYLLILDDVWNENQDAWVKLKSILECGSKGSSIIVTTRLPKVGDIMRTFPKSYCLKELLEEHCWLLFRLRAFGQELDQNHPKLEAIGRKIVKKCAGVPLAAKALGGLLRFKREEEEWIRVEESEIWNLPEEEEKNSILPVLRLSYRHLPVVLKRCFVYCAIFPKDCEIDKQDLIFRWMAHGCISSKGKQEVEDVGDEVWKELVLRSFFQEVDTTNEGETTFKMHDLVHDLAQSIMENKIAGAEMKDSKIREVHYKKFSNKQICSSSIAMQVSTSTTIMNYNRSRILKINGIDMEELPSAIGKLEHLRYFLLANSSIQTLPRTFCGLCNLQTLILDCSELKSLPKDIRCMTNLRHIILIKYDELSAMPSRIRELTCLKTLSLFIVGVKKGNQLDELENLDLGGSLEIKHLERVQNHRANLGGKPNLRDLVLGWEGKSRNMMDDEKVLEALQPHVNLETLKIYGFNGGQFPLWMTKMEKLTEIEITDCPHCSHLPPLGGLPRLRSLILRDLFALEYMSGEDDIGVEDSVFPSLEVLELENLQNLKGLLKKEVGVEMIMMFPNLERLKISNCELLILPPLSALKELSVLKCSLLTLPLFSYCTLENPSYFQLELNKINCIPEDALNVSYNDNQLSIDRAGQWYQSLKSVTELRLKECKIRSSFPEGWIRHFTALEQLSIDSCSELVEMGEVIRYLHLLRKLTLYNVDEMVSLPQGLQHIPTLQSLSLHTLRQLTSLPDWLGNLTSLTDLEIHTCPLLTSLPQGLQHIPTLRSLRLWLLRGLTSLPDWLGNLTSLTYLTISFCPLLTSLPSTIEGITSLKSLTILGCPELERRCQKEKGEDWHIIAHIPGLQIGEWLDEEVYYYVRNL